MFYRVRRPTLTNEEMTAEQFREMALSFPEAVEAAHMGHPDFRAHGRIFATVQHDPQWGGLMLTPEQQRRLLREYGDAFKPAAGAWGAGGATLVHFASIDEETMGEVLTVCWQNAEAKKGRTGGTASKGRIGRTGGMGRRGGIGRMGRKGWPGRWVRWVSQRAARIARGASPRGSD